MVDDWCVRVVEWLHVQLWDVRCEFQRSWTQEVTKAICFLVHWFPQWYSRCWSSSYYSVTEQHLGFLIVLICLPKKQTYNSVLIPDYWFEFILYMANGQIRFAFWNSIEYECSLSDQNGPHWFGKRCKINNNTPRQPKETHSHKLPENK